MTFVDHLKGNQPEQKILEVAFGRHVVEGDLAKSIVTGSSPSHVVTVQHLLGDAVGKGWQGPVGVWFRGVNRPASKFKFHPGITAPAPDLKTFTADSSTDIISCTAHGLSDGDMFFVAGSDLAQPLVPDRIYYARDVTTNTLKAANSSGGFAIDITDNGSGTQQLWKNDADQGVDPVFTDDHPHSQTAWLRVECPSGSETGIPDIDTKENPPTGTTTIINCQLGDVYDDVGDVILTDQLLTNPADVIAFGLKELQRFPNSRIDFESLDTLRSKCNEQVTPDYTELPQGVGLTGSYYDGDAFDTLKSTRVDPVIEFDSSTGAPALDLNVDDFSVRWEGKIRPKYSQTYTFYLTHDNGGKLWVNGSLIIDQWGTTGEHSGTIALTADQFYTIKIEWNETGSSAECRLEWKSDSQLRQVVPQDRLYPKDVDINRFECHVAFTAPTTLDSFLRQVLFSCNGGYQDRNGKLSFFCIDDLTPVFAFDESNIVKNSFTFYPRFSQQEILSLPNRFEAKGRDLESRYLEEFDPPCYYDLADLQDTSGRVITEQVAVGNTRRWQVLSNLEHYAKLRTNPLVCEIEGMPQSLAVLPGDLVTVTHSIPGWIEKQFIVLEATDKSIDSGADNRIFKLLNWD